MSQVESHFKEILDVVLRNNIWPIRNQLKNKKLCFILTISYQYPFKYLIKTKTKEGENQNHPRVCTPLIGIQEVIVKINIIGT